MITNEKLAEIREGLEGVTPGPWLCEPQVGRGAWIKNPDGFWCAVSCGDNDIEGARNASHIARLDPDTIRSLLDRLDRAETALREQRELMVIASMHLEEWPGDDDESQREKAYRIAAEIDAALSLTETKP